GRAPLPRPAAGPVRRRGAPRALPADAGGAAPVPPGHRLELATGSPGRAGLPAGASRADRDREPRRRAGAGAASLGMGGPATMSPAYDEALFRQLVEAWKRGEIVEAPPPGMLEPLQP